ncbi:thioredoxin family protein [Faecalibacter rhinopitheci]|uniref:Thioredoxin family protein n=1 Tax=Faecalibacter rhinopitheci TaxID=2779678 RepID=A0A8J7G785_9FLAO|nr:thioredoxin family protein [Faecalibacter rhinopitheci]MBF0596705.1 thioredoxin family protein [Faecalibacter rhinopitheci]
MKRISLFFSLMLMTLNFAVGQTAEKKKIYDETADAKVQISDAVAKASETKKHVLLQIGGNWCAWCIMFNELTTTNTELNKYMNDNYEVVHVNYSPKNKNEAVLAELKHPERFGFPVFVILDDKGNLIHTQNSAYLESKEAKGHDTKEVMNFLQSWSYKALDPASYIKK